MQATLQLRMSLDRAEKLRTKVEELRSQASNRRANLEKQLAKAKSDEQRVKLEDAVSEARQLELDMNITNLLRAMVDFGMDNLLKAEDDVLMDALLGSKAIRGRPKAGGEA